MAVRAAVQQHKCRGITRTGACIEQSRESSPVNSLLLAIQMRLQIPCARALILTGLSTYVVVKVVKKKKSQNHAIKYELTVHWKSECTILAWCIKHVFAKIFYGCGKNPCAYLLAFVQLQNQGIMIINCLSWLH